MNLESLQVYDHLWCTKGDVFYRCHCQQCNTLLSEGATEDDELCESCEKEGNDDSIGNDEAGVAAGA